MKTTDYRYSTAEYISKPIVFPFGSYHGHPILWRVLASTENEVLVISNQAVELDGTCTGFFDPPFQTYSSEWLNQTFLNNAFSLPEQQLIIDTEVNYANGRMENNKIWMLSAKEAKELFVSDDDRLVYASEEVISRFDYISGKTVDWGLRDVSPQASEEEYYYVSEDGFAGSNYCGWLWFLGVRPAMWISKNGVPQNILPYIGKRCIFHTRKTAQPSIEKKSRSYTQKTVQMGHYKGSSLFWTVLDSDEDSQLLLCSNIIEYLPFHDKYEAAAWDTCTLRTWLNQEFYHTAFSSSEQKRIQEAVLKTGNSQETSDHVWLLSADEARRYFPDDQRSDAAKINLDGPCSYLEPKNIGQYIGRRQRDVWLLRSNAGKEQNKHEVSNVIDYDRNTHKVNDEGRNLNVDGIAGIRPCILIQADDHR